MNMFGAVIVAAGMSSRMKAFKPLLKLGNETIIEKIIKSFNDVGISHVLVVTGKNSKELINSVKKYDAFFVNNDRYYESDMLDSVKLGFSSINKNLEYIFFSPVDIPLFEPKSLINMMRMVNSDKTIDILKPTYKGKSGHPILIKNRVIKEIIKYTGENGLKGFLESYPGITKTVEVNDQGILLDADTPEEYKKLVLYYKTIRGDK